MKDKNITLHPITQEDQPFLREVYASFRQFEQEIMGKSDSEWKSFMDMQFFAQHKYYQEHYADCDFCIILVDNIQVGRLYVLRMKDEIRLVDIALLSEHCNNGVGTVLLKNILEEGKKANLPVRAHVEEYNPAMKLYERLGFSVVEERGPYLYIEWKPSGEAAKGSDQ